MRQYLIRRLLLIPDLLVLPRWARCGDERWICRRTKQVFLGREVTEDRRKASLQRPI